MPKITWDEFFKRQSVISFKRAIPESKIRNRFRELWALKDKEYRNKHGKESNEFYLWFRYGVKSLIK